MNLPTFPAPIYPEKAAADSVLPFSDRPSAIGHGRASLNRSGRRPAHRKSKIKHQKLVALSLICGLLATSAYANDAGQERSIGFQPLEIYKFKMGSSRLIVTDINSDGYDDILFANNHISRLEILLRRPDAANAGDLPELEECFDSRGFIVDQGLKAVRVGDLNHDELPDIVTFGTAIGLQIRYQQDDGTFGEPERIFVKDLATVSTIQLGDMNGDGAQDILVCRRNRADLHWNAQERPFQQIKTLTFSSDSCYYGDIIDINGDGTPDLAFHFNTARNPMSIRYGKGQGLYGIGQPIDLPPRQYMDILQAEGTVPQLGMVLKNRLAFRTYGFEEKEQPALMAAQEISPRRLGLEGASKKSEPAWLQGDFDDDGYADLLMAAPELSRLHLYPGRPEGLNPEPVRIDTLSEVERISSMANGDLLVMSKKEKIAAIHSATDLEAFPRILKTPGDVVAGCAVETANEAWFVCKDDERKLQLVSMSLEDDTVSLYPLEMRNEPADLLAFRLPEGKTGLIFFMSYDTPKMKLFCDGRLEDITSESFRALAQPLARTNVRLGNSGDGTSLTVSQGAIARRFDWLGDRYEAVQQYNPENPQGELIASCGYRLADGSAGTLFFDRNSGDLVYFADEGEAWGKIHIPDADPTVYELVQLKNNERDVIILLDRTGVSEIMGNGTRLEAVSAAEYVSPSENPLLAYAKRVHLGQPPEPMIALVDAANRAIELVRKDDGKLRMELAFEVFLVSDFADLGKSRGTEPHDLESGDLNGDGIGDLVALSQDKLLIYLGE